MMQLPEPHDVSIQINSGGEQISQLLIFDDNQWLYLQKCNNLTPSERLIAELVCKGLDEENIAKNMRIKRGTVKTHARNIYRKMHVKGKMTMLLKFINDIRQRSIKNKSQ